MKSHQLTLQDNLLGTDFIVVLYGYGHCYLNKFPYHATGLDFDIEANTEAYIGNTIHSIRIYGHTYDPKRYDCDTTD
jgi:hypothetical protein